MLGWRRVGLAVAIARLSRMASILVKAHPDGRPAAVIRPMTTSVTLEGTASASAGIGGIRRARVGPLPRGVFAAALSIRWRIRLLRVGRIG